MKIIIPADGRVFEGTAEQIVTQMRSLAFGHREDTLDKYIKWVAEQVLRLQEIELKIEGDTNQEKAESLLAGLMTIGLVEKI